MSPGSTTDWLPIRVYFRGQEPYADCCRLGGTRFTDSFFDWTVERLLQRPFNLLCRPQLALRDAEAWRAGDPGLPVRGFVYHLSRCGSTLVSQMLAALPSNVVLSEPTPVDAVLRADRRNAFPITRAQQVTWLRAVLPLLARRRHDDERAAFVKLDAWHMTLEPIVRGAFPEAPAIFLYRDPVEVLVSLLREPGLQMVPTVVGPEISGLTLESALVMPREQFGAALLGAILEAARVAHTGGHVRLVHYDELPDAVPVLARSFWGLDLTDDDVAAMRAATTRDAKRPGRSFTPDSERKRAAAEPEVVEAVERWARAPYDALERMRRAQEPLA